MALRTLTENPSLEIGGGRQSPEGAIHREGSASERTSEVSHSKQGFGDKEGHCGTERTQLDSDRVASVLSQR